MNVDKYIDIPNENVEESKRSKLENYKVHILENAGKRTNKRIFMEESQLKVEQIDEKLRKTRRPLIKDSKLSNLSHKIYIKNVHSILSTFRTNDIINYYF